jgi:hypothetical protein
MKDEPVIPQPFRRSYIDVGLIGTGWAADEDTDAADAVARLREEFELWVSSPSRARYGPLPR